MIFLVVIHIRTVKNDKKSKYIFPYYNHIMAIVVLMSRLYMLKAQVRICRFLSLLANIFFDASHYKINGMTDAIFKMFHPL